MARMKCTRRLEALGSIDTEVTPGMYYDVLSSDPVNNEVFYSFVGDSGLEIQRSSECFTLPGVHSLRRNRGKYRGDRC